MMNKATLKKTLIGAALAAISVTANAQVNMFDGEWHFTVTPYAFLPHINQSVTLDRRNGQEVDASVSLSPSDWFSALNMTFMINGEARKGDWSIFTDYLYSDFGGVKSRARGLGVVDVDARLDLKVSMWTTVGSYTTWRSGASHLDAFAGFRYLGLKDNLSFNVSAGPIGLVQDNSGPVTPIGLTNPIWVDVDGDGQFKASNNATEVSDAAFAAQPHSYALQQNYPNPFNPSTTIPFSLAQAERVKITVYDILGKEVATLINEQMPAGSHQVAWQAQEVGNGIYIIKMEAGKFVQTRKAVVMK